MSPTINRLTKHQAPRAHRGILFRRLPNAVFWSFVGLIFSFGLAVCLVVANPLPLPVSPRASSAVRPSLTAAKSSESGPKPQVLGAQVMLHDLTAGWRDLGSFYVRELAAVFQMTTANVAEQAAQAHYLCGLNLTAEDSAYMKPG